MASRGDVELLQDERGEYYFVAQLAAFTIFGRRYDEIIARARDLRIESLNRSHLSDDELKRERQVVEEARRGCVGAAVLGCLNLVGRLILRPLLERLAENRSESKSSALAQGSGLSLDACRVSISGKSVTAAQSALMERLMAEQDRLVQLVRTRIYEYYSEVYSIYADDDAPWTAIEVPQVRDGNEIDNNLRLTEIILHRDLPSIGLLFECTWEQEHGLGLRIDDFEFVEIGNAEVAALQ